jgi:gliding motility-associated-like protein
VTGLCFNASPINLTGVPAGGTFTGNGVIGNTFDPAAAGIGVHTINYSYTDGNGCSNFTTLDITVYALPLVTINASSTSVCLNDSPVTLNGTPEGGTFHGNGVIGNLFNPVLAGVGIHTITYQYADENGCENSSSLNIEVKPLPYVDLQASQNEVCVSGPIVTLTGNPIGGIYLGNGVSGNQFNPTVAGVGTHLISYTYTGTNGCSNTTNINIIVHPLPSPMITSLPGPYCVNSPIVNLTANPTGGIFSGTGVSGNTFNPTAAGVGTHTISYSYTDNNNCSNTVNQDVTVLDLPTVTLTASQNSICLNGGIISLSGLPNGGIYSGNGVVGNQFDPSLAGVGVHLVTYQYTDGNGCESSSSINIEVKPLPNVSFIFVPSAMCFNDPNVTLVASPSGGVFTGAGISGNQFDPGAAGIGNHTILYKYTANNGCSDSVIAQITVHPNPTATLSGGGIFCEGDEATLTFNLSGTSAWTVSYTDGNVLYTETLNNSPSSINVNLLSSVTYTIVNVSDQNCSSGNVNGSAVFVVNPLPSLTIVPVTPQCLNNPPVLLNAMPLGGTFSGNGVVGNSFFPNIAGIGNHVISYTYTDGNNCTNSTTTSVEVTDVPNANFVSPVSACVGEEVSLNYIGNASSNAIYTWNFDGGVLTGGTNQNPIVKWNGSGIKTIRLKVLENGCESSEESQTIQLLSLPLASISGNQDICLGENATLNFNATGVAPFTLIYTNGINQFVVNTNSANTSVQVSPVDTTTYTLLSVSDLNCISNQVSGIAKVNVIPLPNNGFNITGGLCTQDTVIVTYAGSFSPTATYTWNFDNPSYQQGSNSGPYKLVWNATGVKNLSLQVSDLGCSSTLNTQTINLGTTPTAEIDGDTVICLNQYSVIKFKFSGALPFNYTYSDGTSTSTKFSFTVNDTAHFKPDSDGSYHINLLTVKDGNGCNATISGNADVLVRPIPFAVLSGGGVVCEGNTDTLKIDFGGVAAIWNYSYTDGNNIYNQSTTSSHVKIPVTPLSDLTYSLINVNNGICDGTVSGSAFFDFVPTPTSSFDVDDEVCLGQSTVITYTGNASPFANYSWDFDGGIAMGNQQGPFIVSWNTAGTKSIKLKVSEIGCESDEAIKNLIVNPLPSGVISGDTNICSGNPAFLKVTLMGNGPWNLVFTDGNNQDSVILDVTNARIMVNPLDTTTYSLITIKDGKGCTGSVNGISTVNVRPTPTADFDINRSVCDGDTVFLKYTGNGSFAATLTWDFDGANIISNLNNREFTIKWSSTGTKLVQLNVEENFCTSNLSNEVVIHNLPTLTALSNLEVCFGDTVRIPLSFTGKAPYKVSYSINTIQQPMQQFLHAQDTLRLLILSNSTINFSYLTDSNTCLNTISQSVNVHVNPLPEIELISGDTVCEGNLANIQYSIIGNFAPWQVVLSDSTVHTLLNTTGSIHVLANDTTYYKVLNIVDAKGCKNRNYEDSVEVITKPIPGSDFNVSKTHVCLDDTIKISYTGQVSNFTQYNWDLNNLIVLSGLGTHELFAKGSTPGIKTIKLKVTDQGCESVETTKTVNVVDYPDATFTNSPIICLGDTALLTVQFRGSLPFNFTYFDGTTTYSDTANGFVKIVKVKPDATGFYILNKVSDAYCSALIGNFTQVIVNPLPIIEVNNLSNSYCISQPPVLLHANVPGTFSSNISNGFMDLGGGNALLEPALVGLGKYEIKVSYTDNNGCSNNLTQIIDILDKPSAEFNFDNFYCADSDTIKITLLGNGQYGRYNIVPSGGLYYDTLNGNIIPNRSIPGKYIVTNIVELGLCPIEIHRDTVEIKPLLPKPLLSNWIDTLICRGTESKIYAISNKLNNVNYTWSVVGGSIQGRNVGDSINVLWDLNAIARLINIKSTDGFCSSDTTYTVSISNATINLLSVSDSIEDDNYVRIRYNVLNAFGIDSVLIFRRISLPVSHLTSWKMIAKKPLTVGLNIYYDGPLNTDLHAYEYRIAIVNRCGDTLFTDPHRVILTQVQGNEQEEWVNLSFSIYKGWTANVYEIYRQLDNDPEFKLYFKTYALNDTSLMFLNVTSDGFVQCYRVLAKWYETDINGIQILKDSSWSNISCVNFTNPIKIYNSFSPNGDGINEFFWIKNINLYPDNEVFIFNRWGARVYHKKQYNNEWDGGGLPDGTYFYVVRVMQDEYRGYVYIGR